MPSSKSSCKKVCQFCGKFINKTNISRHETVCPLRLEGVSSKFECEKCFKLFNRADNLKRHSISCQVDQAHKKIPCSYPNCALRFRTRKDLIEHIKHIHDATVIQEVVNKTFPSWKEFEAWKDKEEHKTSSYYSKKCGKIRNTEYFYCQKDGSSKAHCKTSEPPRKTSRKASIGRVKNDNICISSMTVECQQSGIVHVKYYPTHSHVLSKNDIVHHPLTKRTYKFIDRQISLNQSVDDIKRNVMKNASFLETEEGKEHKEFYITSKLIAERARAVMKSSLCHSDDAESVMKLTRKLMKEDSNVVLIYKPLDGPVEIGPKDDGLAMQNDLFMFGFQTSHQRALMEDYAKNILVVDETHSTNQYGYQLLNLVIVDDSRKGWPVAHLITSKSNENTLGAFFTALFEKIPAIQLNCVITDDDPKLINAMEAGFGAQIRHILCKSHLGRTLKKQLNEKAPRHLRDKMYVALKLIVDTKNSSEFQMLCAAFISKYKSLAPAFCTYFSKFYLTNERICKWASCHRNFHHLMVNTTRHIESFHKRLKSDYIKRRTNKRIDSLIQLLLAIAEDDEVSRERLTLLDPSVPHKNENSHRRSLCIPDSCITNLFDDLWEMKSTTNSEISHQITKCKSQCQEKHCFRKCKSPMCRDLCSHLYRCSCLDGNTLCKHIHKLHSFLNRNTVNMLENEVDNDEDYNDEVDNKLPVFSSAVTHQSQEPDCHQRIQFRENRKKRLVENLKYLLAKAERDELETNVLTKVDFDVNNMVTHVEPCKSIVLNNNIPEMIPKTSFTSTEKLKIQRSQLPRVGIIKRKRRSTSTSDQMIEIVKEEVVLEDLGTYVIDESDGNNR